VFVLAAYIGQHHHLFTSASVESQVTKLASIQRSLFDLETQQERSNNHYEDEIKHLRAELVAAHQFGPATGIPGQSPHQFETSLSYLQTPLLWPNLNLAL
jgi:cob(I)alamin adenosyltransferase